MLRALKYKLRSLRYRLFYLGRRVVIGHRSKISRRSKLSTRGGGSIQIGYNCRIQDYALIISSGGDVVIGDYCSVNPFCVLYGHGGLRIGNGVRIAAHTVIVPVNHGFDDLAEPIWRQPDTRLGIVIGDDVWIGAGCKILDGVTIGNGCVIGAGAVVTKSLPDYSVAVGVPAEVILSRRVDEPVSETILLQEGWATGDYRGRAR